MIGGTEKAVAERAKATQMIGEVALAWADMESALCDVLRQILAVDTEAAQIVFYTPSSFSARADIIINLLKHYVPACHYRDDLELVISKLRSLHNTRNDLIHSQYLVNLTMRPGSRESYLSRNMTHPRRKTLSSAIRNPLSIFSDHLDIMYACRQYLHHLTGISPHTATSARQWLSMARNTQAATSS